MNGVRLLIISCALVILIVMGIAVPLSASSPTRAKDTSKLTTSPWRPDMEPYSPARLEQLGELPDEWIGLASLLQEGLPDEWANWTVAYIGFSHVSDIIITWTDMLARAAGWFPIVWIKDPDPTKPIDADILLVDGFWLTSNSNNTELGIRYIASFLSIEEPAPRFRFNKLFGTGLIDERPVAILAGFRRPEKVLKMIYDILVPLGIVADENSPDFKLKHQHSRSLDPKWRKRYYGDEDVAGWWLIYFNKIGEWEGDDVFDGVTIYELYGNGTLYSVTFTDLNETVSVYDIDGSLIRFTPETLASNDLRVWDAYLYDVILTLINCMYGYGW